MTLHRQKYTSNGNCFRVQINKTSQNPKLLPKWHHTSGTMVNGEDGMEWLTSGASLSL
jgi:hypothetical protein